LSNCEILILLVPLVLLVGILIGLSLYRVFYKAMKKHHRAMQKYWIEMVNDLKKENELLNKANITPNK